jgi:acyl-CoA thioesterase-1
MAHWFRKVLILASLICCTSLLSSLTYAAEIEKSLATENTVSSLQQESQRQPQQVPHKTAKKSPSNILVIGDSISAAFGLKKSDGWVALLQNTLNEELGNQYQLVNASISGDTTTGGRYRLAKALDLHKPKFVIIELGGNDGLRGTPIKQIKHNIETMVEVSRQAGAQPILLGMMIPPNYGERYTSAFTAVYSDVSTQMDIPLVPFLLDGVAGVEGMMQEDGIHPTAAAQATMMQHVIKVLAPLL